jgi:prepilin-type N-terminal cleavage/methylation domain-containing protein
VKKQPDTKQRSGGRAFTMIELLVVIAIIAILAGLLLPAVIGGIKRAEITQAQSEVKLLAQAMSAYFADYQKFPGQFPGRGAGQYDDYTLLVATLQGSNTPGTIQSALGLDTGNNWANQNSRHKVYLQISDKSICTNTPMVPGFSVVATLGDLMDPWGNRYVVVADMVGNGTILADGETLQRNVAVWSWGSDTTHSQNTTNTAHIRSWR